ncbi:MAG: DUF502 domain-containing protein [Planctomycetales bacterium]|nr:DUF502 domain-containing protein [Planctomycetales bacterium]
MNSTLRWTWRGVTATFVAGLFAVMPLVITVAIVAWVADLIHSIVGPDTLVGRGLGQLGKFFVDNQVLAQIIGWLLVVGVVFVIGLFVQMKLRSVTLTLIDAVFHRLPVIGGLYGTASQFISMLNKKGDNELAGMTSVYCSFGAAGGCGILGLMPSGEKFNFGRGDYYAVYIPTSPVPMTGGLVFVPVECVTRLDMSVDKLMSIYLSMGVTARAMLPAADTPAMKPDVSQQDKTP